MIKYVKKNIVNFVLFSFSFYTYISRCSKLDAMALDGVKLGSTSEMKEKYNSNDGLIIEKIFCLKENNYEIFKDCLLGNHVE